MDPHVNPYTGVWDDNWYAMNYGGGGGVSSGGGDTELQQLAKTDRNPVQEARYQELLKLNPGGATGLDPAGQAIYDAINKQNEKFIAKIKEFDTKNPFVYDTILEEEMKKVGQRLDPYYRQTVDDFLTSINRKKSRSLEDERRTLSEISMDVADYTKENKMAIEDALEKSREGYADAGLYSSGARAKAEGRIGIAGRENQDQYVRNQERRMGDVKLSTQRDLEDVGEQERVLGRDVGRYDPLSGGFKRGSQSEAEVRQYAQAEVPIRQQQRQFELRQYAGAPAGVDQASYYMDTYNLLR